MSPCPAVEQTCLCFHVDGSDRASAHAQLSLLSPIPSLSDFGMGGILPWDLGGCAGPACCQLSTELRARMPTLEVLDEVKILGSSHLHAPPWSFCPLAAGSRIAMTLFACRARG